MLRTASHPRAQSPSEAACGTRARPDRMSVSLARWPVACRTAEVVGLGKSGATRDERLGDVGLVVLDEVHYLGDPWRGSVWEEAIINCPRHIQVGVRRCCYCCRRRCC